MERKEAYQALYEGLLQSKRIIFTPQHAKLTEDEQRHMLDVSRLLHWNRFASIASLLLLIVLLAYCSVRKLWKSLYRAGLGALVLLITTLVIGLLNFNGLFYLFHRVLFRNDLWLLPADSVLLKIFPSGFFFQHFIGIFSVACGWFILLMVVSSQLSKRSHT